MKAVARSIISCVLSQQVRQNVEKGIQLKHFVYKQNQRYSTMNMITGYETHGSKNNTRQITEQTKGPEMYTG